MRNSLVLASFALVTLAGCNDQAAQEAAVKAKADAQSAAKARDLADALKVNVRCHAGLKWQEVPLKRGGIGDPQLYVAYYRNLIERKLGDTVIPAAPPAPQVSEANLDQYLAWAAKDYADHSFAKDRDAAINTVATCVQSASEFGAGPMAKLNPAERFDKIHYLRDHLRQRGN